jgi:hypothetical protein
MGKFCIIAGRPVNIRSRMLQESVAKCKAQRGCRIRGTGSRRRCKTLSRKLRDVVFVSGSCVFRFWEST